MHLPENNLNHLTPSIDLLTVSKDSVDVFSIKVEDEVLKLEPIKKWSETDVECATWSPCGYYLCIAKKCLVRLFRVDNQFSKDAEFDVITCEKVYFSPKSSFLVACSPCSDQAKNNLVVWNVKLKQIQLSVHSRIINIQEQGLPIVWSAPNELYFFRLVSASLNIYCGELSETSQCIRSINLEKPVAFEICNEKEDGSINVAVFCASSASVAGKVLIYSIQKANATLLNVVEIAQVQRSRLSWNYQGSLLLAAVHNDVDSSGKSYYGSSCLYLLNVMTKENTCLIDSKQGPISDFSWFPNTNDFTVIYGHVPPHITIFDGKTGKSKYQVGDFRRNLIRFNRFGRFMCLGGFGNFAGEIDIYDRYKKKNIGSARAAFTVDCEWSPDGRHLLCSTTTPRMRVDNCIKIFRYNGDLLTKLDFNTLYHASWRPLLSTFFKDRPASRGRRNAIETIEKPKAYRPPHATNTTMSTECSKTSCFTTEKIASPAGLNLASMKLKEQRKKA